MAMLKSSVVQGSLRVTDTTYTDTANIATSAKVGKLQFGIGPGDTDANSRTISVTDTNLIINTPSSYGTVFQ